MLIGTTAVIYQPTLVASVVRGHAWKDHCVFLVEGVTLGDNSGDNVVLRTLAHQYEPFCHWMSNVTFPHVKVLEGNAIWEQIGTSIAYRIGRFHRRL